MSWDVVALALILSGFCVAAGLGTYGILAWLDRVERRR